MKPTSDTKQILCKAPVDKGCELSLLSAVIHTCAVLSRSSEGTTLALTSTNSELHTLVSSLLTDLFSADGLTVNRVGRDTVISGDVLKLLEKVRILGVTGDGAISFIDGIARPLINSEKKAKVYLRGVFLGAGSFSPSSWHLEIGVTDEGYALALNRLIASLGLSAHVFSRKDKHVVYLKKREDICDFFGHIGATKTMLDLIDRLNTNKTRKFACCQTNLEMSNMDRTISVGVAQIAAIRRIEERDGLACLDDKLYEVAKLRLTSSELSYDDMAEKLGISKGSIKYRLKRIMEIANSGDKR